MDGHSDQRDEADGNDRMHDQCQGVVFEPSVWRSTSTPFSYFSRMILGTGFPG